QDVIDLREFGNVSEDDFTDSAIKFIEAGERFLHGNGIIRGFEFKSNIPSTGTLLFKGGQAMVNGHVSNVNAQSITIPEVVQIVTGPVVTNLDWAICVNDRDELQ